MTKVLVIEPELHIRQLVETSAQRVGCEVMTLSDLSEGSAMIQKWQPDIIVTELIFPSDPEGGLTLLREIRKNPATHEIGFIFFSHEDQDARVFACWQDGTDAFVIKPKPINSNELMERVRGIIQSRARNS